ncbi:MAG: theronine dehydrogenase [Phycisphaeraceae bacterium]|nr:theronine dehydrogenase [Phycisphaeraceae bacterium]
MRAKAIVFEAERRVAVQEIEIPEPTEGEVVVRSTVTGVSVGTERWALTGQRPEIKYPNVPGYLGVGVVEQVGAGCEGYRVGDRVFFFACRLLPPHGEHSWMTTHVSRAVVPVKRGHDWPPYVCRIPDGVPDSSAAMAGLGAVAARGVDMIKVTSKDIALVLGLGMIGQGAAQVLRAKGARVVVADMLPDRVERALEVGADAGVVLDGGPIHPQVAAHLPANGADIVVDTTSVAPVVQQLADLVRMEGQVLLQGYYPGLMPFNLHDLHGKRPSVQVACAQSAESHEYVHRLIAAGMAKLEPLVTHRASPSDAPEIYQMVLDKPDEFLGIVFEWA